MRWLPLLLVCLPLALAGPHEVHQSHANDDTLGFDYCNGVEREGTTVKMDAYHNDRDFCALNLEGSNQYQYQLRFRADTDGTGSIMRWAFSYDGEPVGEGRSGNGFDTGAFADSLQLRFEESGDRWNVALREVIGGNVQTLATNTLDNPNNYRVILFALDGEAGTIEARTGDGALLVDAAYTANFDEPSSLWMSFDGTASSFCQVSSCGAVTYFDTVAPSTQLLDLASTAPEIQSFEWAPSVLEAGNRLSVQATIVDDYDTPDAVFVYEINGQEWAPGMSRVSQTYSGQTPVLNDGDVIRFSVKATDNDGGETQTNTYRMTVGSGQRAVNEGGGTGSFNANDEERDLNSLLIGVGILALGLGIGLLLIRYVNIDLGIVVMILATIAGIAYAVYDLVNWENVPWYAYAVVIAVAGLLAVLFVGGRK